MQIQLCVCMSVLKIFLFLSKKDVCHYPMSDMEPYNIRSHHFYLSNIFNNQSIKKHKTQCVTQRLYCMETMQVSYSYVFVICINARSALLQACRGGENKK